MSIFALTPSTVIALRHADQQTEQHIARLQAWIKDFTANPPSSLTYEATDAAGNTVETFTFSRPVGFVAGGSNYASTTSAYAQRFTAQVNTAKQYIAQAQARLAR